MMTITLLLGGAGFAAAMGIYDAYSNKRGAMDWIVSIIALVIGGVVVGAILPQLFISIIAPSSNQVAGYIGLTSVAVGVIAGGWIALWLVNRFQ